MQIFIQAKQIGRKKNVIASQPLEVSDAINTLEDLIRSIISIRVNEFNSKENFFTRFLTGEEIVEKSTTGKVGFGARYNEIKQSPEKAVEAALQALNDGLFIVMLNETQLESSEENIALKDGDILTFIRLVMLAGRLW